MRASVRMFFLALILTVSLPPVHAQPSPTGGQPNPFSPGSSFLSSAGYLRRVVADLAPTGRIRVAVDIGNPTLATKDPTTGELRGVVVDLARDLAASLKVPLIPVEYRGVQSILTTVSARAWDVAFLAISVDRTAFMDFSDAYMQLDNTYLVPQGSRINAVADADQTGVRIGVNRGAISDVYLTGTLKRATIVRADAAPLTFELLRTSQVDAMAGERSALLQFAARLPGSRVLNDRYLVLRQGIAIPKGHAAGIAFVWAFVERAKASGLVKQAIEHAGLRGVDVAPLAGTTSR